MGEKVGDGWGISADYTAHCESEAGDSVRFRHCIRRTLFQYARCSYAFICVDVIVHAWSQ